MKTYTLYGLVGRRYLASPTGVDLARKSLDDSPRWINVTFILAFTRNFPMSTKTLDEAFYDELRDAEGCPLPSQAATSRRRRYWPRAVAVMKEWLRNPSQVASVIPSSSCLTELIADRDCVREARRIVDLGPGTGGTTETLLQHAAPHCRVLAIEKTAGFIEPLRDIGDSRLTVVQDDAVELEHVLRASNFESADVIVSGIPFSSLKPNIAEETIQAIHRTLADGGVFIAYQLRGHVATYAKPWFGEPTVNHVLMNIPPLRVFVWNKTRS